MAGKARQCLSFISPLHLNEDARRQAHRALFRTEIDETDLAMIRDSTDRAGPWEAESFVQ